MSNIAKLITEEEVAERLNVSKSTLRKLRRLGTGPKFLKIGVLVRYTEEGVKEFCTNSTATASKEVA